MESHRWTVKRKQQTTESNSQIAMQSHQYNLVLPAFKRYANRTTMDTEAPKKISAETKSKGKSPEFLNATTKQPLSVSRRPADSAALQVD